MGEADCWRLDLLQGGSGSIRQSASAIAMLMVNAVARADDVVDNSTATPWHWSLSGGITAWENLGDVESITGESFDDVGLGFGERSRFFLEAGAGWYNVDFAEFNCYTLYTYCFEPEAAFYTLFFGAGF